MSVNNFGKRLSIRTDTNGQAWHGLGGFQGEQTAVQTLSTYSDGIPQFEKLPTYVKQGDNLLPTTDYAIIRQPTLDDPYVRVMGYCGTGYRIVTPDDIAETFDARVNRPIETLGFLGKGEKMFVTWEMPKSIFVGGEDEVKMFGTVLAGFDGKVAVSLSLLTFRVVCQNTFNAAQGLVRYRNEKKDNKEKNKVLWVGRHNSPNIVKELGAWMGHIQRESQEQVSLAENLFSKLLSVPVKNEKVLRSLLEQVYPVPGELGSYPEEIRKEKEDKLEKEREKAYADQAQVYALFNGEDKTISGNNLWQLFNNVTYYENHVRESKKDATNSVVFGNRKNTMNEAFSVMVDYALTK